MSPPGEKYQQEEEKYTSSRAKSRKIRDSIAHIQNLEGISNTLADELDVQSEATNLLAKWQNEKFTQLSEQLDNMQHNYRVHVKGLDNRMDQKSKDSEHRVSQQLHEELNQAVTHAATQAVNQAVPQAINIAFNQFKKSEPDTSQQKTVEKPVDHPAERQK